MKYTFLTHRDTVRLAVLILSFSLSGCGWFSWFGGDDEEKLEPAELVKFSNEVSMRRLWSTSVGDGQGKKYQRLVPALSDAKMYVASTDGQVAAFDAGNGKRLWRTNLKRELSGGVGVGEGLVLVGTTGGLVLALEQHDGRERWHSQLSSEVLAAPAAGDGVVVTQTFDGHLFGLSADEARRFGGMK